VATCAPASRGNHGDKPFSRVTAPIDIATYSLMLFGEPNRGDCDR
jgi:hypothetical protein